MEHLPKIEFGSPKSSYNNSFSSISSSKSSMTSSSKSSMSSYKSSNDLPKIECKYCIAANTTNIIVNGILFYKKTICENYNGHLGFICPIDKTRYGELSSTDFHIDNIKTYCSICFNNKHKYRTAKPTLFYT